MQRPRSSGNSWQEMENFLASKVAAGYVLVFLLCPLNPCVPSLVVPVGILPTDLKYTSVDLARWVGEICVHAAPSHDDPANARL